MTYSVGTLVRARGREWVVLPGSSAETLLLRPLGGGDEEVAGVHLPLEPVEPATFPLPDPSRVGDHRSCRLLRDAFRLGSRAGAGPFRSLSRIAVEPRPYQIVPLLMALRLDPVRLLIADDVGIGKTVEACLIARELLDRGEISRLAVLCPPHLAGQWERELREKFHIECELVLSGTAARLERGLSFGRSLFEAYPFHVVSTDFIKSDARSDDFVRAAPEMVIVDEAHTCAPGYEGRGGRQLRHRLLRALAGDAGRHLLLVTATPHSGNEDAFRSLLGFLRPEFTSLPADLSGAQREPDRRRVAEHFIQRRRANIRRFMGADTPFPDRESKEETYRLSAPYRRLLGKVIAYARERVSDQEGGRHRQRVRWWSALALLRSLGSSPAAAAATLRSRAPAADTETEGEADAAGRRIVFDAADEDAEPVDVAPGSDDEEAPGPDAPVRRRLLSMAHEADALKGGHDAKIEAAASVVERMLEDGYSPIVFCKFIPTAEYVAFELSARLREGTTVESVTGILPALDREALVHHLSSAPRRVLVCTDCLSEGINLQENFDAVLHYDLSWNPTRHEQREGRVDRFGQPKKTVRVITLYGADNPIDGIVLEVLIRKHAKIRSSRGIL